jgi:hypothetical protein
MSVTEPELDGGRAGDCEEGRRGAASSVGRSVNELAGRPHDGQNRAPSCISSPHCSQRFIAGALYCTQRPAQIFSAAGRAASDPGFRACPPAASQLLTPRFLRDRMPAQSGGITQPKIQRRREPMKKCLVFFAIFAFAIVLPAVAQTAPKTIVRVFDVKVKNGAQQQFEEGVKKVRAWQKEHNYPLRSLTWSVISGERTGDYMIPNFAANWKDFDAVDKLGPAMSKEIDTDVGPYVDSVVASYWESQPDLDANPPQAGQTPPEFISVTTYFLKPGGADGIENVIKQAKAAIEKTHWPNKTEEWYMLENGGTGPQFLHIGWRKDWADFAPPEPSFVKMLSSVYGKAGSDALYKEFLKSVHTWRTEIYRYRPELSYIPAGK